MGVLGYSGRFRPSTVWLSKLPTKLVVLALPVLFLFFFLILPLAQIVLLALGFPDFSLQPILSVLSNDLNLYFAYWNIQQALLSVLFSLVVGLPGAYLLANYDIPGKVLVRNLLTVPFVLPPIVVLMGFISVFGLGSELNQLWQGLFGVPLVKLYNSYEAILLAHVFYNIPVIIRVTEVGFRSVDPNLEAIARSLGASRWRTFWKVTFPQIFPSLAAACLLVFIYTFNSFAIVLVLGGAQYQTLEVRIYSLAKVRFDYNAAAALTVLQVLINVVAIFLYLRYTNRYEVPTGGQEIRLTRKVFQFPVTKRSLAKLTSVVTYFGLVGVVCTLPLVGVAVRSVTSDAGLTLEHYGRLVDEQLRSFVGLPPTQMLANSLLFGLAVLGLATFLAVCLNYGLNYETTDRGSPKLTLRGSLGSTIVILPLCVSSVSMAFALFSLYRTTFLFDNPAVMVVLAHTLVAFPFANRIIAAGRASMDPSLVNVARSLGASRLTAFIKVELPLLLSSIVVAGLFSFAISLGEFGATSFLSRTDLATVPVGIYRLLNTRQIEAAAALSTILVVATVVSFALIERLGKASVDLKL